MVLLGGGATGSVSLPIDRVCWNYLSVFVWFSAQTTPQSDRPCSAKQYKAGTNLIDLESCEIRCDLSSTEELITYYYVSYGDVRWKDIDIEYSVQFW